MVPLDEKIPKHYVQVFRQQGHSLQASEEKNYEFLTSYAFGLCLPMENEIITDRLEMQSRG